jgi:hypothetical protein
LAAAIPSTDKSVGRDSFIFRYQSQLIIYPSGKSRRESGKLEMEYHTQLSQFHSA